MPERIENTPGKQTKCSIKIEGIDCADCAKKIERAVSRLPGVKKVTVGAVDGTLRAEGEAGQFDPKRIAAEVRSLGYHPSEEGSRKSIVLVVPGMDCPDEERAIRQGLAKHGLTVLGADYAANTLTVSGNTEPDRLLKIMRQLGFPAGVAGLRPVSGRRRSALRTILAFYPLPIIVAGAALQFSGRPDIVTIPLYLAAIIIGIWDFARKGLRAALRLSLDMNTLMTIAVIGAMALGDWLEAATTVFLFSLANLLEARSLDRARRAVESLMQLAPPVAVVKRDSREEEVPVGEVRLGEIMVVKPGSRIPLDGIVRSGSSSINQAPITGESLPVFKQEGDEVFAGTINGEGTLEVEATSLESDSTLARVVALVQEAQAARAPTERLVDRFARRYTPTVVLLAVLFALATPLFLGGWEVWFYRALVLLVIACPCALVISTPVGIVSGLTSAARSGVLIKGGTHLERTASIDLVAFDKTGTLTFGRPKVSELRALDNHEESEVLLLAASLERYSEHPLALAVTEEARRRGLRLAEPKNVRAVPGKGIEGTINGETVRAGSHRFFEELGLCEPLERCPLARLDHVVGSVVCVARGAEVIGAIVLRDALRPSARVAINRLHGIPSIRTAILTGDNRPTAEAIGAELEIDDVAAALLPQDKLERLKQWRSEGRSVMMVGDGVNDAPALAAADVGVAMGAAGTDAALETADIALMADDLAKVPFTIAHSKRTMGVIRQNIFLSVAFKLLFVLLAVVGLSSLWMAIAADMGVSLAVIANSLRLLRPKGLR